MCISKWHFARDVLTRFWWLALSKLTIRFHWFLNINERCKKTHFLFLSHSMYDCIIANWKNLFLFYTRNKKLFWKQFRNKKNYTFVSNFRVVYFWNLVSFPQPTETSLYESPLSTSTILLLIIPWKMQWVYCNIG